MQLDQLVSGLPLNPLPPSRGPAINVPHAPKRKIPLTKDEFKLAVKNALRYFPATVHDVLAPEFADELRTYGHIYMYRFVPDIEMRAYPISSYSVRCSKAAAIMLMIMNNLDHRVAQFPEELITYGGNGQVFSNWAQFWLVMHYLSMMEDDQTLVMYSGHPLGLFPSSSNAPRVVITNGMMIPNYSSKELYDKYFALGVTMYGQMTAGSYCYIGPQGIVHGTTITVLNAGRKRFHGNDLAGKVFVSAGLGGMSGAQAKAAVISGCIGVIAEVSAAALKKRHEQGWLMEYTDCLDDCIRRIKIARQNRKPLSLGYLGNVVDLWEKLAGEYEASGELLVDLGSDQTSCHAAYTGGYYPVQLTCAEADDMMTSEPEKYKQLVHESLRRQIAAISKLTNAGMYFFDYGNAFLLECQRAGADVLTANDTSGTRFKYPSYVQDIMGDIFSLGFGPFRWVCTSGEASDLQQTDRIALDVMRHIVDDGVSDNTRQQYVDNMRWIEHAAQHKLVVGSQARILYSDHRGRMQLALAFNEAVAQGKLLAPVVISRDHHDVSGTDSPYRETSNIYDGSAYTADMAVQNAIGDSFRGATWVALHNGGGTGWGEAMNGGFGMVLDGSEEASRKAQCMLSWDVTNGIARRCWSGNIFAREAIETAMQNTVKLQVTLPHTADVGLLDALVD